jgi:hypothetical protein
VAGPTLDFWQRRFETGQTAWDRGDVNPQLRAWLVAGALEPTRSLWALFMQAPRAGAREGRVEGPPYHCDINAMRALFPSDRWEWPTPPYASVPHPMGVTELAVQLVRR